MSIGIFLSMHVLKYGIISYSTLLIESVFLLKSLLFDYCLYFLLSHPNLKSLTSSLRYQHRLFLLVLWVIIPKYFKSLYPHWSHYCSFSSGPLYVSSALLQWPLTGPYSLWTLLPPIQPPWGSLSFRVCEIQEFYLWQLSWFKIIPDSLCSNSLTWITYIHSDFCSNFPS